MIDAEPVNLNIVCQVCGEGEFEQREGFYYCRECGVKQEQVRSVEVENADAFNETTGMKRQAKTTKIKVEKAKQPQVTSWECYNYILRGFVEELMAMGAKEELKLMALQVWAAYLRRMEVAFFNKKHLELPRLGLRYLKNDAETIYNHTKKARVKNKRKRNEDGASTGGEEKSNTNWRKNKRKLDESIYSSLTSMTSATQLSSSNASGSTNKAIKLNFNMNARKYLKKRMSVKHLARHENDTEGILQCHKQPRAKDIGRNNYQLNVISLKQVYAVLGIALNLIGDDIQLCDLVRFINEGHIGSKNILTYFPENIAKDGKNLLKRIDFYKFPDKYSDKFLRDHISLVCYNLHIHKFNVPNMVGLVRRYVTELCLPQDIVIFAERLINFLPPRLEGRAKHTFPQYEARAMAYIIFILKLLFGLDGQKEHRMSRAASKLNRKIDEFNKKHKESRPLLFVWNEWVEYIEMRKVIVSHYSPAFCRQFKQCESASQILDEMSKGIKQREEDQQNFSDHIENSFHKQRFDTFRSLISTMLEENSDETNEAPSIPPIEFKHSLTPALSYFKTIMMHYDNANAMNSDCGANGGAGWQQPFQIFDYMRVNHADRDVHSYLEVKPLVDYFQKHQQELKVYRLDTTENRIDVGIFEIPNTGKLFQPLLTPSFNITDEEWTKKPKIQRFLATDDLEWKTDYEIFEEDYYLNRVSKMRGEYKEKDITSKAQSNTNVVSDNTECQPSIEAFAEHNMDPLGADIAPAQPRRNLDKFNIFTGINDEDSLIQQHCADDDYDDDLEDNKSSDNGNTTMDSLQIKNELLDTSLESDGLQGGGRSNILDRSLDEEAANESNEIHKFYVSNMDCWILMGSCVFLGKPQRSELLEKFPPIFKWLIETCAQSLGLKWIAVYEQLLAIEIMFGMGIENLDNVGNCVYMTYLNPIKEFQSLITSYRDIW